MAQSGAYERKQPGLCQLSSGVVEESGRASDKNLVTSEIPLAAIRLCLVCRQPQHWTTDLANACHGPKDIIGAQLIGNVIATLQQELEKFS